MIDEMRKEFDAWSMTYGVDAEHMWEAWQAAIATLGSKRLPCDVHLMPGMQIGRGCPYSTLLLALGRRAEYELQQSLLTDEERDAQRRGIEEFKRLLEGGAA